MKLFIIMLARCNASCGHCSLNFGPHRREALGKEKICKLMDEAAAIDDGDPLEFHLTGGEPFLDTGFLRDVVEHGTRLGGFVTCVTNGFWARSTERARETLEPIRAAGLRRLAVSVSRFHLQFVSLQRVRLAIGAARELGIETELKGALTMTELGADGAPAEWREQLRADSIQMFPVLPRLREGASIPEAQYYREDGLPMNRCPGEGVCVDYNGMATSCGAPGNDEFLSIGNVWSTPLVEIQRRFKSRGKQRILREAGPIAFALGARAAGLGDRLRDRYAGPCDLCLHVRADPELRKVADTMSNAVDAASPN